MPTGLASPTPYRSTSPYSATRHRPSTTWSLATEPPPTRSPTPMGSSLEEPPPPSTAARTPGGDRSGLSSTRLGSLARSCTGSPTTTAYRPSPPVRSPNSTRTPGPMTSPLWPTTGRASTQHHPRPTRLIPSGVTRCSSSASTPPPATLPAVLVIGTQRFPILSGNDLTALINDAAAKAPATARLTRPSATATRRNQCTAAPIAPVRHRVEDEVRCHAGREGRQRPPGQRADQRAGHDVIGQQHSPPPSPVAAYSPYPAAPLQTGRRKTAGRSGRPLLVAFSWRADDPRHKD